MSDLRACCVRSLPTQDTTKKLIGRRELYARVQRGTGADMNPLGKICREMLYQLSVLDEADALRLIRKGGVKR